MTVDEVTVRIVLDQEVVGRKPVIKHLGPKDVSTDTPGGVVSLRYKPLAVSKALRGLCSHHDR